MKKIKLMIICCGLISLQSLSQSYGEFQYNRTGYNMSCGSICTASAGMVMAGYDPSSTGANFAIDRSDVNFTITGSPWEFGNLYDLNYFSGSCAGTLGLGTNCAGVSIIETTITGSSAEYAIAGTFDEGVFFATLDITGAPIDDVLYRFPSGATNITKPSIVESTVGDQYFICGSYYLSTAGNVMYVIKVDDTGNIINSRTYDVAGGLDLFPKDMVISPYTPSGNNELVIIGYVEYTTYNSAFLHKPFFLRLKQSDITNISCRLYGQQVNYTQYMDERFSAITVASSTNGGNNGFVCAGYSDSIANTPVWLTKLNSTGVQSWSRLFEPNSDKSAQVEAVDLIERAGGSYSYNYFALCTSTVGMMVLKFDNGGNKFLPGVAIDDKSEFIFQPNLGNIAQPSSISYLDNGGSNDIGIHVFGTFANTGQYYMVEAPFNGVELGTCNQSYTTNIPNQFSGPPRSYTVGINTLSGLSQCNNFSINSNASNPSITSSCVATTLPPGASLNKGTTTSIQKTNSEDSSLRLYPNPTKDKINVEINSLQNSSLKIELYDALSRLISICKVPENITSGKQNFEIDFSKLNIESGIYFIHTKLNSTEFNQKIMYSKE